MLLALLSGDIACLPSLRAIKRLLRRAPLRATLLKFTQFLTQLTNGHTKEIWHLAVGRFATIFLVTLLVQAPAVAFAFLVPGLLVHGMFGLLSGYVTHHLLAAADRRSAPRGEAA